MEQHFRREQDSVDSIGGAVPRPEVPKAAGHILLHESPQKGEIHLNDPKNQYNGPAFQPVPAPENAGNRADLSPAATHLGAVAAHAEQTAAPVRTERSAWHTIGLDHEGHVMPQEYGQAFQQELRPEMAMQQPLNNTPGAPAPQQSPMSAAPATSAGQPLSQPVPDQPQPAPNQPVPNQSHDPMDPSQSTAFGPVEMPTAVPQPKQPMPANPLYSIVPNRSATPSAVPQAEPQHQQVTANPMGGQHHGAQPVSMTGAVNPSFAQPQMPQEPQLPSGQIDAQHRLPAPRNPIKAVLTNPWVWLVVGLVMVWYFSRSLFN